MRYDEFKSFLDARPFKPIRVLITSGQYVDIRHPEQALVTRSTFAFATGNRKEAVDAMGWYSLIHVVKIEYLSTVRRRKPRRKRRA
jgi:hypothetical protein